jgi:hypothetical protein
MVKIPIPVPRLCLCFEFDIESIEKRPSNAEHDAAIKQAARTVDGFIDFGKFGVTENAFSAKVIDGKAINPDGELTLKATHNAPFDPNFHVAHGGPAIRYEFIYSDKDTKNNDDNSSKLFLRIVTSFGKPEETIDGVLATRIGLTAIEILQGNEVHPTIFPRYPPLTFGMRQLFNFFHHNVLNGMLAIPFGYIQLYLYTLLEQLGMKQKADIFKVNNTVSLLKFHSTKYGNDAAKYNLYRSEAKDAFKTFLNVAEKWTKKVGLDGYFYLINMSPFAAPAITYDINDVANVKTRYHNAFAPAGPPPGEDIWKIMNFAIASKTVINNYGKHKHNFTAKPISFIWDWLHVRNTAHLAACITINGVFLSCFRGLEASLEQLEVPKETFPFPPAESVANVTWNKTMK